MRRRLLGTQALAGATLVLVSCLTACVSNRDGSVVAPEPTSFGASADQLSEGAKIAYLANDGGFWQVWVTDPREGGTRQVTTSRYEKSSVSWFPDGRRILVHALSGKLIVVDVATGREELFTAEPYGGHDATVSPDGRTIAVSSSLTSNLDTNEIVLIDVESRERSVMPSAGGMQHTPRWSHDGQWIYFVVPTNTKHENNIWRVRRDGTQIEQLTIAAAYHFSASDSSDGVLAYSSNQSGDYEIWSWDIESGEPPHPLTRRRGFDGEPAWSPDGSFVVYASRIGTVSTLWIVNAQTADSWQLVRHERGARSPVWWGRAR